MKRAKVDQLVWNPKGNRTKHHLLIFAFLLLVTGLACTISFLGWSEDSLRHIRGGPADMNMSSSATFEATAQGQYMGLWIELSGAGVYTPTTMARGVSLSTSQGEIPPFLDELASKGYLAIRVPHAPPTYTASSLVPGIPPWDPNAVLFSYYSPPSTTTLTIVPISVTRRTEYESLVNDRFPITDGQSHWEVWWLPKGEKFPIPNQPFRLDENGWSLALSFRIDFVDSAAFACAGCPIDVLLYNGYIFIGPYETAIRYTNRSAPHEPLLAFGAHCSDDKPSSTLWQYITPTKPFTHVLCLENWDTVTRTFTISATSSQGWEYAYYYRTTTTGAKPIPTSGIPFTVTVGPSSDFWGPGSLWLLAVHTPTIVITDTMRETFHIMATSVTSPNVRANTISFAAAPGYQLDEGRFKIYLPLVVNWYP